MNLNIYFSVNESITKRTKVHVKKQVLGMKIFIISKEIFYFL